MFYKQQPDISQVQRHYCRNPHCAQKLKIPVANRRAAFCCKGCAKQFYRRHCLVCEVQFSRKTERQRVCWRSKCRYEFLHHPGSYFSDAYPIANQGNNGVRAARYPTSLTAHNASRNPIKPGIKIDDKPSRAYRIIAGPAVPEINLRVPPELPASKANKDFENYWQKAKRRAARKALIKRNTPPVNVIGGYRFPSAPTIDLRPIVATPRTPIEPPIGDGLDIPAFLRRTPTQPATRVTDAQQEESA